MRVFQIKDLYPETAFLIQRLLDEKRIILAAAETLRPEALAGIESGETSTRDATVLLVARTGAIRRQK